MCPLRGGAGRQEGYAREEVKRKQRRKGGRGGTDATTVEARTEVGLWSWLAEDRTVGLSFGSKRRCRGENVLFACLTPSPLPGWLSCSAQLVLVEIRLRSGSSLLCTEGRAVLVTVLTGRLGKVERKLGS